jgi:hypothetical protein
MVRGHGGAFKGLLEHGERLFNALGNEPFRPSREGPADGIGFTWDYELHACVRWLPRQDPYITHTHQTVERYQHA